VFQLDEHERDGRVAQRPRQVAEITGGVRLRALVLAQGGFDGKVAAALMEKAKSGDLFAKKPEIHKLDILADKLPK
jgi:hypothetical protein